MGLFKKKNKEPRAEPQNPYGNTSMPVQKDSRYEAFNQYASQKASERKNLAVRDAGYEAPAQPQYQEETYEQYKQRKAREQMAMGMGGMGGNGGNMGNMGGSSMGGTGNPYGGGGYDADDLNAPAGGYYDPDDLNATGPPPEAAPPAELTEEQKQQMQEEEELEEIKGRTRFRRDQTYQLTENIIGIGKDSENSGMNTMGILGASGEVMSNIEQNLAFTKIRNKQATQGAKELRTAGNLIKAPQNPFGKKSRLQKKEQQFHNDLVEKQIEDDANRSRHQQSNRVILGQFAAQEQQRRPQMSREERLKQQRKYLIDGEDSEEEEKELKISENIDVIHNQALNLRRLGENMSTVINDQNPRLRDMENDLDRLNIEVQENNRRLHNIIRK